jgi:hypothetical protein
VIDEDPASMGIIDYDDPDDGEDPDAEDDAPDVDHPDWCVNNDEEADNEAHISQPRTIQLDGGSITTRTFAGWYLESADWLEITVTDWEGRQASANVPTELLSILESHVGETISEISDMNPQ